MKNPFLQAVVAGGMFIGIVVLLIVGNNIWYEIQAKKTLTNFVGGEQVKKHLSNGIFQKDLECYPEAGTTILRVSCLGVSYEVSNEVCQKLKSELLQKDEQCDSYEWFETQFKNKSVYILIKNSGITEGKTVTFLAK